MTTEQNKIILWHSDGIHACGHDVLEIRDNLAFVQAACAGDDHDGFESQCRVALDIRDLQRGAQPLDVTDDPACDWGEGAYGLSDPCGCGEFYLSAEDIRRVRRSRLAPRSTQLKTRPVTMTAADLAALAKATDRWATAEQRADESRPMATVDRATLYIVQDQD